MIRLRGMRPLLEVFVLGVIAFALHKAIFFFLAKSDSIFQYSLSDLYSIFLLCSLIIAFILVLVRRKNIDNVGYVFLLLTCIKMGIAYLLLRPVLNHKAVTGLDFEKITFFIVFSVFLTIETITTIRLLNNKQ